MSDQLISLLQGKIKGNTDSIDFLLERRPGIQTNIDLFNSVCTNIDTQIVSITANIVNLQTEIVNLSNDAYAVGCGTTAGAITIYPDTAESYGYNLSSSSYDGDSPYDVTTETMNSGNVGFGTLVVYTENNTNVTGIGTLYGDIGTCFRLPCTLGNCISFASSITERQNEIIELRSNIDSLVSSSNSLKRERVEYEIERYSGDYTIKILREENTRISSAVSSIQVYS